MDEDGTETARYFSRGVSMKQYIVCVVYRVSPSFKRQIKNWARDENAPNVAEWAYRFDSEDDARAYADKFAPPMAEIRVRPVLANINNVRTIPHDQI